MYLSNVDEEEIKEFYKLISRNIKKYRIEKNMSQLELSLAIGQRGNAFYSYAENNKNNKHFNLEHLYKIAKELNVDICDFLKEDVNQSDS